MLEALPAGQVMSDAPAPVVAVDGLGKRFAGAAAVDGCQLHRRRGEIFGLVGPDGAGKTTTMRMLAGVMQPDDGGIVIDGVDVVARSRERRSRHLATCRSASASMRT